MSRRSEKKGIGIIGIIITVIIAAVLIFSVSVIKDAAGIGGGDKVCAVEIPDGAGSSGISKILKEQKIIKHPVFFKLYTKLAGQPVYQKGIHNVNTSMSYKEISQKLQSAPDGIQEKRIVIPEGYELRQIADLLSENGLVDRNKFMNEIENGSFDYDFVNQIPKRENRLEGYLYPDTYMFSTEENEHDIINKMLAAFNEKVMPEYKNGSDGKSLDDIIIMASVIEREAANDEERPIVASVFYNRIKIGMKLESCATVQYILKERKNVLSNSDTAIDSPYNTYKYSGLPKGPIASPGISSIKAALSPADTNYLYFLATADGSRNLFSETFEEHNQKLRETQE